MNVFKFDTNENQLNNHQCIDVTIMCTPRGVCMGTEQLTLGHRIVILKGSPIYCDDEILGLVSKAVYETGYLDVNGLHKYNQNNFVPQKKEFLIKNSIKNVDGFQSLRNLIKSLIEENFVLFFTDIIKLIKFY